MKKFFFAAIIAISLLFTACDEAEKLEYLIDYDPYIFDSEGKIKINFINFEEFSEKS